MSWPLVKLSEIFEIARGGSPRPISDYITENTDGLNWISIKDASNSGKYISKTKLKIRKEGLIKSRLVKPGDFLLTNSMSFGRPYIMNTTGCIHDGWLVLSSDKEKIDQEYFYYLLGSDLLHTKFSRLAAGAVVKNLNISLVKGVEVPLPPLAEQKKIAEILDAADSLRQKAQQLIEYYTSLSQSLFLEMFGDPVTNPMGWDEHLLSELTTFENGDRSSNYPSGNDIKSEGILFLSTKNIKSNRINLKSTQFITEEKFESLSRGKVIKNDLLITLRGTLGNCCVFNCEYDTAFINAQMMIIRTNNKVLFEFLHLLISSEKFNAMLQYIGKGAAVPQLTASQLGKLMIFVPPITLQHQFIKRIESIEKQKQQAQANLEKSEALFNSLLQRAFKGELTESKAA